MYNLAFILSATGKQIGDFKTGGITDGVNSLNKVFYNIGTYAGAILIALAIFKIIMALHEQSPHAKMQASMLLGGGIVMTSFSAIMNMFSISEKTTALSLTKNALTVIETVMTYAGAIILGFAIFQFIMSFLHEQPEERANASKLIATGITLMTSSEVMQRIKSIVLSSSDATTKANGIVSFSIELIGVIASYTGAGLLMFGFFTLVCSFKEEDISGKSKAGIMIGVAVALLSFGTIMKFVL